MKFLKLFFRDPKWILQYEENDNLCQKSFTSFEDAKAFILECGFPLDFGPTTP